MDWIEKFAWQDHFWTAAALLSASMVLVSSLADRRRHKRVRALEHHQREAGAGIERIGHGDAGKQRPRALAAHHHQHQNAGRKTGFPGELDQVFHDGFGCFRRNRLAHRRAFVLSYCTIRRQRAILACVHPAPPFIASAVSGALVPLPMASRSAGLLGAGDGDAYPGLVHPDRDRLGHHADAFCINAAPGHAAGARRWQHC